MTRAYESDGILCNSDEFNNMENRSAINDITKKLEKIGMGEKTVNQFSFFLLRFCWSNCFTK